MIGVCPRCGRELVRSSTPTGKVCFRCASCGGVAVTLPVLRESLDVRGFAGLTPLVGLEWWGERNDV